MPLSKTDAFLADVAAADPPTLHLLAEVVGLLDGLYPIERGMLPAPQDRYGLVADVNKLGRLRHRLRNVVDEAARKSDGT